MDGRRGRARRWTTGLCVAFAVNTGVIALLAITAHPRTATAPPSQPILELDLRPETRTAPVSKRATAATTPVARAAPTTQAPRPQLAPPAPVSSPLPASAAPSGPAAPAAPSTPASDDSAKAAAALRRMLACGGLGGEHRRPAEGCESLGGGQEAGHVEAVPPERRAAFEAEQHRQDELVATTRRLQAETFQIPGNVRGHGPTVRYGCNLKHGKWSCGTY